MTERKRTELLPPCCFSLRTAPRNKPTMHNHRDWYRRLDPAARSIFQVDRYDDSRARAYRTCELYEEEEGGGEESMYRTLGTIISQYLPGETRDSLAFATKWRSVMGTFVVIKRVKNRPFAARARKFNAHRVGPPAVRPAEQYVSLTRNARPAR